MGCISSKQDGVAGQEIRSAMLTGRSPDIQTHGNLNMRNVQSQSSFNASRNPVNTLKPQERLFKALFDYRGRAKEDLSILKNDTLVLLDDSDENWWLCRNKRTKEEGFVPSNHIAKDETLQLEPWYFGEIKRNEAEKFLLGSMKLGMFLIRNAESDKNDYSLSVCDGTDQIKHYRIKILDNLNYYISNRVSFKTISELVRYYSKESDGLCCLLMSSPQKNSPETFGLSKNTWEEPKEHFKLISKLGAGQFGEVWKATYKNYTKVAIKTLKPGTMTPKAFLEEANIMKQLRHPNLVQLLAVCTEDEPLYIITEYMKNGSLLDYLKKNNEPPSLWIVIDMATQIATGMSYLEAKKIIHRDLAARNILVSHDFKYKIADFGLTRITQDSEYNARGNTKFPVKWTAPEAATHHKFSTKSDVWSYGITLYEIVTSGAHPYPGISNSETIQMVRDGYRMPCHKDCDKGLYKVMLDCWHSEPDRRPTFEYLATFFADYKTANQKRYLDV